MPILKISYLKYLLLPPRRVKLSKLFTCWDNKVLINLFGRLTLFMKVKSRVRCWSKGRYRVSRFKSVEFSWIFNPVRFPERSSRIHSFTSIDILKGKMRVSLTWPRPLEMAVLANLRISEYWRSSSTLIRHFLF